MEQQRKGDFMLKYNNVPAILDDSNLTTAEKVVELVKHHSMCLFGLASDVGNYYDNLNKLQARLNIATAKCKKLEQSNAQLRAQLRNVQPSKKHVRINDLTSEERKAVQADYYEQRISYLLNKIQRLQQQLKQQGSNDNGK